MHPTPLLHRLHANYCSECCWNTRRQSKHALWDITEARLCSTTPGSHYCSRVRLSHGLLTYQSASAKLTAQWFTYTNCFDVTGDLRSFLANQKPIRSVSLLLTTTLFPQFKHEIISSLKTFHAVAESNVSLTWRFGGGGGSVRCVTALSTRWRWNIEPLSHLPHQKYELKSDPYYRFLHHLYQELRRYWLKHFSINKARHGKT